MTPVPQRNIDTFGGGSIPKNPDPVAVFKERLRKEVEKIQTFSYKRERFTNEAEAARQEGYDLCEIILTLIDQVK